MEGSFSGFSASSASSGTLRFRLQCSPASTGHGHDVHHSSSSKDEKSTKLRIPLKAACTAGVLALLGDTAAQLRSKWVQQRRIHNQPSDPQTEVIGKENVQGYDWIRALRMTSYGFLIYGPSSQVWYTFLDHVFHQKTVMNLSIKVILNQVVLGPYVIAVVFAWNSLWQGRLDKLPALYAERAFPTLVDGWKFWIPASMLNFGVIPLQARVAFMSSCAIFWNFYLSTTMGRA
ncbi:hypothetical protein KP509_19G007900 [Ceratopteris richardii]|uniref:Uncharacterized protein n=1 Tax=Ceratopteris richardii TaxID=49495 RepID=A0A8T2SJL5_CERRI|nr:hypothetical protein KP509_19G007900 [Ceratopteris richardii]